MKMKNVLTALWRKFVNHCRKGVDDVCAGVFGKSDKSRGR